MSQLVKKEDNMYFIIYDVCMNRYCDIVNQFCSARIDDFFLLNLYGDRKDVECLLPTFKWCKSL